MSANGLRLSSCMKIVGGGGLHLECGIGNTALSGL